MANQIFDTGLNSVGNNDGKTLTLGESGVTLTLGGASASATLTSTYVLVNGVTASTGTFSGGGAHVVTVTNGIITNIS